MKASPTTNSKAKAPPAKSKAAVAKPKTKSASTAKPRGAARRGTAQAGLRSGQTSSKGGRPVLGTLGKASLGGLADAIFGGNRGTLDVVSGVMRSEMAGIVETAAEGRVRRAFARIADLQQALYLCGQTGDAREASGARVFLEIDTGAPEKVKLFLRASLLLPAIQAAMAEDAPHVLAALAAYQAPAGSA